MKLPIFLIGLSLILGSHTSLAGAPPEIERTRGAASGLIIGAIAGGPIGGFSGAVLGGELIGTFFAQKRENRELRDSLMRTEDELSALHLEKTNLVAELNQDIDTLLLQQQKQVKESRLPVFFRTDSTDIEEQYSSELSNIAKSLKDDRDARVNLYGHADRRGNEQYNERLSYQRVQSIEQFLVSHGVHSDQISSIAFGESQPQDHQETMEGNFFDRRVIVELNMGLDPQLATR